MTTWTPATKQGEAWTVESQITMRVFSPFVFSRRPVFDTGPTAGLWDDKAEQAETWTSKAAP